MDEENCYGQAEQASEATRRTKASVCLLILLTSITDEGQGTMDRRARDLVYEFLKARKKNP